MAEAQQDPPTASPDYLPSTGRRGSGVRRLNRVPILVAVGMASVIVAIAVYTVNERRAAQTRAAAAASQSAATPADPLFLQSAPENGLIAAGSKPENSPPTVARTASAPIPGVPPATPLTRGDDGWKEYTRRLIDLENQRLERERQALLAETSMHDKLKDEQLTGSRVSPAGESQELPDTVERTSAEGAAAPGMLSARSDNHFNGVNGQREKRDFLHQQPVESDYLRTGRAAPISPFEVKAGTVIPGVMISGVNSDLPGQLVAQVSENVYDTATGRYLLIPQGAKLVGTYDNSVTFGQRRILVAWRRIIYPDASSLDLGAMPGADESGYAGFKDKVDNHLLRLFGQAILLSIFSAGIQLGSPQANSGAKVSMAHTTI